MSSNTLVILLSTCVVLTVLLYYNISIKDILVQFVDGVFLTISVLFSFLKISIYVVWGLLLLLVLYLLTWCLKIKCKLFIRR